MAITGDMKIHELIDEYPYMREWLVSYSSEFERLNNPVLFNTVGRIATLDTAASMAHKSSHDFLNDVREAVARKEIMAEELAGSTGPEEPGESARRQEMLKDIIRKLHEGASVDAVKAEFDQLIDEIDSAEIARMEQALIAEGMPVEEVQRLCDVHVTVFKEALEEKPEARVAEDHPIDHYQRENKVIGEITGALRCALENWEKTPGAGETTRISLLEDIAVELARLNQIETHYVRKENQLFPVLEQHGVEGPTKVMWGLDNDILGRIKTANHLLEQGDIDALAKMLPEVLGMVEDMVYKEEKILFPTALQVVTEDEWAQIAQGDHEIGFAWIDATPVAPTAAKAIHQQRAEGPMLLPLPTGALSLEQLDLLFRALPFDVTYVDEHDSVRFYSEGERVFPRSPAVIGRQVRNCHPPASVHKVDEILASFRAGTHSTAEFWIQLAEKFVYIRYFALRDAEGNYRGCLEVVQDATHVRSLTDQRRIVDWR